MTSAWKAAGLTYNRYLAVASQTVRRSLKSDIRVKLSNRGQADLKFAKWENGKQGDAVALNTQATQKEAASK